jgi:nucleotidyltransferase substrate binding protein (TIGR01987 family)
MNTQDIRWQQRFRKFQKAFLLLESAIAISKPSVSERAGLIDFFEMTFKLGWKLLKDFMEAEGFIVVSPRDAINQAFQAGIISQRQDWIDALENKNQTLLADDEQTALEVEFKIRANFFPLLKQLHEDFRANMGG